MKKVIKNGVGEIEEKKSRFIGHIFNIESEDEANQILASIKKKYWDARHNCYAYVLGDKSEIQRFSDDGEPSGTAGKPILEVLNGEGLTNCLCVVTRYFGGVLLGTGGLVRAYSLATKEGISNSEYGELINGIHCYVDTDYNMLGKIQYIAAEMNVNIINTEYSDNVEMELSMSTDQRDTFVKKLSDISAGQLVLRDEVNVKLCACGDGRVLVCQ